MIPLLRHRGAAWLGAGGAVVVALATGASVLPPERCIASAILAGMMAAIAFHDLASFRVPDILSFCTAVCGLVASLVIGAGQGDGASAVLWAVIDGALCGGALLLVRTLFRRLRGRDGLGLGDVKLGAAAGIWLGWELFVEAILLASLAGLLFVAVRLLIDRHWNDARRIPFAAAFAPAIWVCWQIDQLLVFRA